MKTYKTGDKVSFKKYFNTVKGIITKFEKGVYHVNHDGFNYTFTDTEKFITD